MEIVDIGCPRSIDLLTINDNKDKDIKSILQTVDIYDHVIIKQNIRNTSNVLIESSSNINKATHEKLNELILIFANYVNMKINNISIDVKYDSINCLKKEENILAGFLLALNYYFKNNLTTHELIYLANKIDNLISYYITGGYKKIDMNHKNYFFNINIYNKYYLFDNLISNQDMMKIQEILNKYQIEYGKDDCFFIPTKDIVPTNILIKLKRELPNTIIRTINNTKEHKVLVKYLK